MPCRRISRHDTARLAELLSVPQWRNRERPKEVAPRRDRFRQRPDCGGIWSLAVAAIFWGWRACSKMPALNHFAGRCWRPKLILELLVSLVYFRWNSSKGSGAPSSRTT